MVTLTAGVNGEGAKVTQNVSIWLLPESGTGVEQVEREEK
jgi:hypothetical protein